MNVPVVTMLELRAIESILEMGGGYVLKFSDRTFAAFFREHGVDIDNETFREDGTSKANRLRCFLRKTPPPRSGQVLAALLAYRLTQPGEVTTRDAEQYRQVVLRLGGALPTVPTAPANEPSAEAALLRHVFRQDVFARLPGEAAMARVLVARMEEAQRCVESKSYLAAVILCGSVLEGMCLSFGGQHPERSNRAFVAQYSKAPPQFHAWKLKEWIEVLGRLGDLSPNITNFGHALRDFRNYVHPAEQLANKFAPDEHTARIAFQVVVAAADDLVRAHTSARGQT